MPKKQHCLEGSTLAQVEDLIARTPNQGLVRTAAKKKRKKPSVLDPHRLEILEKHSKDWGYDRIANYLAFKFGIKTVTKSTIGRRIHHFLGGNK